VPVPLPMSQLPYRKAMVADLFFGTIKGLALDSAFSSADLIATTAGYFGFNTSSAEDEATVASAKIRAAIFNVEHLTGLGFRNRKGDTVSFDSTGVRPKDIRYFAFRSVFTASAIDSRGPDTPFSVEFVLRLPQTLVSAADSALTPNTLPLSPSIKTPDSMAKTAKPDSIAAMSKQIEETDFDDMSAADIRAMLKRSMTAAFSAPVDTPKRVRTDSDHVTNLFGDIIPGSSLSPKMDGVLAASSRKNGTTYNGVLDFLEDGNQPAFDSVFGTNPLPLVLVTVRDQKLAVEETDGLRDRISAFISYCQLIIFCSIVQRQYVGASDYDQSQIITDVEHALSQLKMEFKDRHRMRFLTPDDLYRRYQDFIPLLPQDANEWSFHLVVLYLNALPIHLKESVVARGYKLPQFRLLSTKVLQQRELELLREATVAAQRAMEEEKKRIRAMINSFTPPHNSGNTFHNSSNPSHSPSYSNLMHYGPGSIAEQTLSAHRGNQPQVDDPNKPLVKRGDLFYPQNPETKFISKFPVHFRGCLGCGNPDHLFRACSQRGDSNVRHQFWNEMRAHIPASRKNDRDQQHGSTNTMTVDVAPITGTTPSTPSSAGVGRKVNNLPAWMTSRPSESVVDADKPASDNVEPWFLPIMARITAMDVAACLPMPIQINNNLPCIDFCLGLKETQELRMRMLVDSGAAMNSGNKNYHRQAMHRYPDMVAEYLECGPGTKFDLVKLRVAVDSESILDGSLSAIIRYKTPYFISSRPLLLSFALGESLSLNTILGTPALEQLRGILDMGDRSLNLQSIGKVFPLIMQDPGLGKKGEVTPLPGNFCVPESISSNVPSSVPLLQHLASSSSVTFQHNPTPSDQLTVKDAWEGDTFSRNIEFNGPPTSS